MTAWICRGRRTARGIARLCRLDDIQGGPLVLDWVAQDLRWAATLVRSGAYDNQTGVRLHEAFAELAQLAGWVATDLDRVALAQRYFLTGLRAAHTAGDRLLGANIVSCLSYQAAWHGADDDALRLVKVARTGAAGHESGAVQALLATRQARAHAKLGDVVGCERALEQAAASGSAIDGAIDPCWSYWVTPAVLAADAGRAWLELGRPTQAEEHLVRGLELFGQEQPRNRLLHNASLAEARLACEDIEGAAAAAHSAMNLSAHLDSQRARARLRVLHTGFGARDTAVAREVRDRVEDILSA
ncbi:hypothetical protein AB0K43_29875 [Kitasatospora sp. NPDC049258]|uniref:hypothetical protein n=1 Tax=Kitasatospora sp. NPDC049258 TaxID=3155394 RepID=UPI0034328FD4